ncbi:hypothetical protein BMETH_1072_0 [methanotrophic bacterial endosymbiont of Bathymodiolus sp.]|nr:hypothetical protein BMETH_1072_0 [methanotrophic bacterial endosymbiont of Bathymodiolus sp.]
MTSMPNFLGGTGVWFCQINLLARAASRLCCLVFALRPLWRSRTATYSSFTPET